MMNPYNFQTRSLSLSQISNIKYSNSKLLIRRLSYLKYQISPRLTFPLFTHRERLYLSLSSSSWIPLTGSVSFCGFVNLVTKSRNNLQI
ncbi:hypothetical protein L2E82_42004 [Cichorium intybus]|uniref:Uncharacterized protein n=1 Tax=Cichorium intybus TaxID=13427 RepID=A0ACB8ZL97_CICIN|nr:hypothetical protein L2E82_42004 [Cichorium intybus]